MASKYWILEEVPKEQVPDSSPHNVHLAPVCAADSMSDCERWLREAEPGHYTIVAVREAGITVGVTEPAKKLTRGDKPFTRGPKAA
jgi:hypothetical protein